jgi:hypothetical protein
MDREGKMGNIFVHMPTPMAAEAGVLALQQHQHHASMR